MPEPQAALVSVIVVSYETRELLRTCLASLRHLEPAHEVLVVDNASRDGSADMVARDFPAVRLLRRTSNEGFGRGHNAGMAAAHGDVFVLLNSDAWLPDGSLGALVEHLRARPTLGLAGPRLVDADGRLQPSAYRFGSLGLLALEEWGLYKLLPRSRRAELLLGGYWAHDRERAVDWLVGACLVVRRAVYERTGGFDPGLWLYGEEVEWCRRVRAAGYEVLFWPQAQVRHLGRGSTRDSLGERRRLDRCLLADDLELRRRQGVWTQRAAGGVRVLGALLKLVYGVLRSGTHGNDVQARALRFQARAVLDHYRRRLAGRLRLSDAARPPEPDA